LPVGFPLDSTKARRYNAPPSFALGGVVAQLVLDTLRELQQADQELRRLEGEKAAHDRTVRVRAAQIRKQEAALEKLQAQRKAARAQADQKELEVRSKQDQIERLKGQQLQVRDNRQYATLQNEIKFAELAISKLEDEILNDYEDLEGVDAEIAEAEAALARSRRELDALRQEIEQEKDEVDARIEACRKSRRDVQREIPPDIVERFNRIADRTGGEALAPVVRDEEAGRFSCGGCNMGITQNSYVLLMGRSEELVTCPNCSRILYVEEP
jgi:hypothetical protein